jgi:hypothetical protein
VKSQIFILSKTIAEIWAFMAVGTRIEKLFLLTNKIEAPSARQASDLMLVNPLDSRRRRSFWGAL